MTEFLTAANLASLACVRHGFFTRQGGVSEGAYSSLNCGMSTADDPEKLSQNEALIVQSLGLAPDRLLFLNQVHGSDVVEVTGPWALPERPAADAFVTREKGLGLAIQTADCVPILFADEQTGVIGAAHAGWRSAVGGVIENTIQAMEKLGAQRPNIQAAIGPCIWQDSYEVGPDFYSQFMEADFTNNRFFVESDKPEHYMFDLPGFVRDKLKKAEIGGIALSPADTFQDEARFFSFRRCTLAGEDQTGRQLSIIMLVG